MKYEHTNTFIIRVETDGGGCDFEFSQWLLWNQTVKIKILIYRLDNCEQLS